MMEQTKSEPAPRVGPLEWAHADTCLSDYWSGHHLPHVAIPATPGMSMRAIKDEIRHEIRAGAIMGSDDDARLLSADMVRPGEEARSAAMKRAAYAAVNRMRPAVKGTRRFFRDIPYFGDGDGETVYAFFVLVPKE